MSIFFGRRLLPSRLRRQVALAAFIKAILLNNDAAARGLASQVIDSYPKLKLWIETWLAAKSPDEQSFAAAFMMLKNPGLRFEVESGAGRETSLDQFDSFRDNWWPSRDGSDDQTAPGFLSVAEKKSAEDEWLRLSASVRFISLDEALTDPVYAIDPNLAYLDGEPFLAQIAIARKESLAPFLDREYSTARLSQICK